MKLKDGNRVGCCYKYEQQRSNSVGTASRRTMKKLKSNPHSIISQIPNSKKQNPSEMVVESLTDLPQNMLLEILVRLPSQTLFTSKCVCKKFLELTSPNPHFIELHSSNAPQSLVFQFTEGFLPSCRIRMLEPELLNFEFKPVFQVPEYSRTAQSNTIETTKVFVLVNSCNGLLYFVRKHARDECSLVCNPVTNEYIWAVIVGRNDTVTRSQWLGFDSSTNQYKVLRIWSSSVYESLEMGAQILELGSGFRRNVTGNAPLVVDHSWDSSFTFVDGVIYWYDPLQIDIVSFDFEKEVFGEIDLPNEEHIRNVSCVSIGELGGCLALSYNDVLAHNVDVWVMEKRVDQESWSKKIAVDTVTPSRRLFIGHFKPLQILRNGELLMIWMSNDLILYNPRNKRFRLVGLRRNLHPKAVLFRPSFVPLKDALKVEKVFMQNVRPRAYESDRIRGGQTNFSRGSFDDGFLSL